MSIDLQIFPKRLERIWEFKNICFCILIGLRPLTFAGVSPSRQEGSLDEITLSLDSTGLWSD
jgi:hypothetical protein